MSKPTSALKRLQAMSLGWISLLLLLGFHAVNVHQDQLLTPVQRWWSRLETRKISLSSGSDELFSFRFLAVGEAPAKGAAARPSRSKAEEASARKKERPQSREKPPSTKPAAPSPSASAATPLEPAPPPNPLEVAREEKKLRAEHPPLDPATQWLSWIGIHLRALVDQSQQRWIDYRYRGKRYYFLRDEIALQYQREKPVVESSFRQVTRLMRNAVERAGATLVIVPMPTKTSINRNRLPAWLPEQTLWTPVAPSEQIEDAYGVYSAALEGAPSQSVDVFGIFARHHRRHPRDDLYIPSNHQWTSLGIALTTTGVIRNLRGRGWKLRRPKLVRLSEPGELYDEGLLKLLNLPPQFGWLYPQTREREPVFGVRRVVSRASKGRLIVFGTCFSDRLRGTHGFSETLANALGRRKIINLSTEGGKTLPSFKKFVRKHRRFKRGDLVVWEFNVRETFTRSEIKRIRHYLKRLGKRRRRSHTG